MGSRVTFKIIPADQIFNACDPSFMYDVAVQYKEQWWDAEQDGLRKILHENPLSGKTNAGTYKSAGANKNAGE